MVCKELKIVVITMSLVLFQVVGASSALKASQSQGQVNSDDLPSIDEMTEGMQKLDGFLPLYWDGNRGELWLEVPELNQGNDSLRGLWSWSWFQRSWFRPRSSAWIKDRHV